MCRRVGAGGEALAALHISDWHRTVDTFQWQNVMSCSYCPHVVSRNSSDFSPWLRVFMHSLSDILFPKNNKNKLKKWEQALLGFDISLTQSRWSWCNYSAPQSNGFPTVATWLFYFLIIILFIFIISCHVFNFYKLYTLFQETHMNTCVTVIWDIKSINRIHYMCNEKDGCGCNRS